MNEDSKTMKRPGRTAGMRHVALRVNDLEACEHFYVDLLGMIEEWRPDADNLYLTNGNDNLALHRVESAIVVGPSQSLDHIGFIIQELDQVDEWYTFLKDNGVKIHAAPKTHRDGARSFYVSDPQGNIVQIIYHPPIANA